MSKFSNAKPMNSKAINAEVLISLVHQFPTLWDRESIFYKCRNSTVIAWREVCRLLTPQFDEFDSKDKNLYVQMVSMRWKHLKDAYVKALKRSEGTDNYRGYRYETQMAFLSKYYKQVKEEPFIITENDLEDEDDHQESCYDDNDDTNDGDDSVSSITLKSEDGVSCSIVSTVSVETGSPSTTVKPEPPRKRKSDQASLLIYEPVDKLHKSKASPQMKLELPDSNNVALNSSQLHAMSQEENNRYLLFFRSLLPSLSQLTEEQALDFQVGVLRLIQDVRQK